MFSKFLKMLSPLQWGEVILLAAIAFTCFNLAGSIVERVQTTFGIETKSSLKEKVINQDNIINKVEAVNKDLIRSLGIIDKSNTISKDAIVSNYKTELKLTTSIQNIKNKKVESINKIKEVHDKEPVTVENTKEMETQVSTKQINSLWETYCLDPDNSTQCEVNKNV